MEMADSRSTSVLTSMLRGSQWRSCPVGRQQAESIVIGAVVPSLVRWGLSADADLVFRCLSSFGPQPARWIATDLGLTIGRVRSALEELEAAGAVQATTGLRSVPRREAPRPG